MNFTIGEKKDIWIVGSLERLGRLGYFNKIGYNVAPDCIDLYWELDDIRYYLFDDEEEIFIILMTILEESNFTFDQCKEIHNLILNYLNNRTKVFSYAMENLLPNLQK